MYFSRTISVDLIIYGTKKQKTKSIQLKKNQKYLQIILNMLNLEKPKNNSTSEATAYLYRIVLISIGQHIHNGALQGLFSIMSLLIGIHFVNLYKILVGLAFLTFL